MIRSSLVLAFSLFISAPLAAQQSPTLASQTRIDTLLVAGGQHDYVLQLPEGHSAELVVRQNGVDVVVEVRGARDSVLQIVDSPTGRTGEEVVELFAEARTTYRLRVRPYDRREPEAGYQLEVRQWRNASQTAALLSERKAARDAATAWLRTRSAPLTAIATRPSPFDTLAIRVKVLGIGEATHGSREFGDVRLALTRRLIERHGYRTVAIEASHSRLELLDRYARGDLPVSREITQTIESGWIGRRTQRELVSWLRDWNSTHRNDPVRLVGLDPQDNAAARATLAAVVGRAYGAETLARLRDVFLQFEEADRLAAVFGDAGIDSIARSAIMELQARLELDAPLLVNRIDADSLAAAQSAARELSQFADFNSDNPSFINHSRDWYMAANLLRATQHDCSGKVVYWAHNAHIAAPTERSPNAKPMGSWLRELLGCAYGAVALTFGEGSFVAQIPNDLEDDLAISTLPFAGTETLEAVLAPLHEAGAVVTWTCPVDGTALPGWLARPQPLHWIGALWTPGSNSSEAFRPFQLTRDFDAIVFIPKVTADEVPTDRPLIPPRQR